MAGALSTAFSGAWMSVAQEDAVTGWPAAETYPGAITTDHGRDSGPPESPGRAGPLSGQPSPSGYPGSELPQTPADGIVTDTATVSKHAAPTAGFPQTEPFAPPGPVADTHGLDTGGTWRTEHVLMPQARGWRRWVRTMQTWHRQDAFHTTTTGWRVSEPNGREDHDQYQTVDYAGYDPRWIPYSERPIQAKFAVTAHPVTDPSGGYIPSAALPDMTPAGGQGNWAYSSPGDPAVTIQGPAGAAAVSPGAALGMEYVGG